MARCVRDWFNFLPEAGDEVVDRSRSWVVVVAPDMIQKLVSGKWNVGLARKTAQKLEFFSTQYDITTGTLRSVAFEIHDDIAKR